jgi:hypothetical protein
MQDMRHHTLALALAAVTALACAPAASAPVHAAVRATALPAPSIRAGRTPQRWTSLAGNAIALWIDPARGGLVPADTLRGLVLHELGHALGLAHDPEASALMSVAPGPLRITRRDRAALHALYGARVARLTLPARWAARRDDRG